MTRIAQTARLGSVLAAIALELIAIGAQSASAATHLVRPDGSGDFVTIQEAVDAASDGDVIELSDGTFQGMGNRDIELLGKNIIVQSRSGNPHACIIDCEDAGRGFHVHQGETAATMIVGITIRDGHAVGSGADGGGICCENSSPTIQNCVIESNRADDNGGGVYCRTGSPTLLNCIFIGNHTYDNGGGLKCSFDAAVTVTNCTFVANTTTRGQGGGLDCNNCAPTITNCILWENSASRGSQIAVNLDATLSVSYTDAQGGQLAAYVEPGSTLVWEPGNLDADPLFTSGPCGEFYLSQTAAGQLQQSPCVDAGDPCSPMITGTTRTDAVQDTAVVDMGYHYVQSNRPPVADAGPDQSVHVGVAVTLDGSDSSDPDMNTLLTPAWTLLWAPQGSNAELVGDDTMSPTFIPDVMGDYIVELVVTDDGGLASVPDEVIVSTENAPPIADPGDDQAIIELGTEVCLDGTGSWDDDGDPLDFVWTLTQQPAGSDAVLNDAASQTPCFVADVHGTYVVSLVVSDPWTESEPADVTISFDNVKPVADAGVNQSVLVGATVYLDGTDSWDANSDTLTFLWSIVSCPAGSTTVLVDPEAGVTSFLADLPGQYVVSLVVNDGFVSSDASNVTVMAKSYQDAVTDTLDDVIDAINLMSPSVFKNKNMRNTLTNKINAVLDKIDRGMYDEAYDQLQNDILQKTNGCADSGAPDNNDWIRDCATQAEVYPLILEALSLLETLIED